MFIKILFQVLLYIFLSYSLFAESDVDQWQDTEKTYFELIEEGFNVVAYDTSNINTKNGYLLMFFVTVLQKENQVYECQEYQTLDENMLTISMTFICRKLVQPYKKGIGT